MVISIAQHLDDCAESFLMSVMHNGFIRTMKANYEINAGDVSVIRPLVYCRESLMTEFVSLLALSTLVLRGLALLIPDNSPIFILFLSGQIC